MATKPTVDPKWATDQIATDNIEPAPALKTGGIPNGSTLGREHLNWMFNSLSQWVDWVRSSALDKDNNLSDLTNVATARTNLGLMTAATTIGANTSGNAATATKLATARTITLSGDVSGSTTFDGSANKTITCTVGDNSHNHSLSTLPNFKYGVRTVAANSTDTVGLGSTVVTAMACQNSTSDLDSGGIGVTWSGSNITLRNSYGAAVSIVYWAWVS